MDVAQTEMKNEYRARQLMQVWRDYYDEILEINYAKGTYISLVTPNETTAKKGFVDLDLMLLLKKRVHPDDAEKFKNFMDKDRMLEARNLGQKVSKLNFRFKSEYDNYVWIKVKNIIPEYQGQEEFICYSCFRRVDLETNEDLKQKQELSDGLERALEVSKAKGELLEELSREFRSPLQGIIGMSQIARMSIRDIAKTSERLEKIEKAAKTMADQLDLIIDKDRAGFADEKEEVEEGVKTLYDGSWQNDFKKEKEAVDRESFEEYSARRMAETEKAEEVPDENEEFDFSGRRVLVVEDNPLNCETMIDILEMTGLKAEAATDGKQAVVKFVSNPVGYYDSILMDIELPIIDGVEATHCIRISGKDDADTVPIFAISAKATAKDHRLTPEFGFTGNLQKPVDFKLLYRRMRTAIDNKKEFVVAEELSEETLEDA